MSDLRGLDTFSQGQAAQYMNRSLAKFKQTVKNLHIPSYFCDGIKTFRKSDLQRAQERERNQQWRALEKGATHINSVIIERERKSA